MGLMMVQIGDFCASSKQAMEDLRMQVLDAQNRQRDRGATCYQYNQIANLQSSVTNLAQPSPDPGYSSH